MKHFTDIPNIGPKMAEDFQKLGIKDPGGLKGKDAHALYQKMCGISGTRQDPCVLDTYIAAVAFMEGSTAKPWWSYTAERKRQYPDL